MDVVHLCEVIVGIRLILGTVDVDLRRVGTYAEGQTLLAGIEGYFLSAGTVHLLVGQADDPVFLVDHLCNVGVQRVHRVDGLYSCVVIDNGDVKLIEVYLLVVTKISVVGRGDNGDMEGSGNTVGVGHEAFVHGYAGIALCAFCILVHVVASEDNDLVGYTGKDNLHGFVHPQMGLVDLHRGNGGASLFVVAGAGSKATSKCSQQEDTQCTHKY